MIKTDVINQLEILQCIICSRMFDTQQRKPMLICESQHSTCKQCLDNLMAQDVSKRKCPMCRVDIIVEKVSQFRALIEMRDAASKIRKDGSAIKKTLSQAQKKEQQLSEELSRLKVEYKQLKWQIDATNQLHLVYIQQLKAENAKQQHEFQSKIKALEEVGIERLQLIEFYSLQLKLLKESEEQFRQKYQQSLVKIEELQQLNSYFMKQLQNSSLKQTSKKKQEQSKKEVEYLIKEKEKSIKIQIASQKTTKKAPSKPYKPSKNDQIIDLSKQDLQQVDLSDCKKLRKLYLTNNRLTHIDLQVNIELQHLNLRHNELVGIDLSNNEALSGVDLSQNKLTFVLIKYKPDMSVDLANQNTKNCDVMVDCFTNEEKSCQKFIEEQMQIYRIGGNKWGNNCNEYQCIYSFQIIR